MNSTPITGPILFVDDIDDTSIVNRHAKLTP